jgi:hypothetical protein
VPLQLRVECEQDNTEEAEEAKAKSRIVAAGSHASQPPAVAAADLPRGVVFAVALDVTLHLKSLHSMLTPPRERALREAVAKAAGIQVGNVCNVCRVYKQCVRCNV